MRCDVADCDWPCGTNSTAGGVRDGRNKWLEAHASGKEGKSAMIWWPSFEPGKGDYLHVQDA